MDTRWFLARIRESPYRSLRGISPHILNVRGRPMADSGLVLRLHGRRHLRIMEARQLADLIAQPLPEVLRRAGVDVRDEADDVEARLRVAVRMVATLLGVIDEHGVPLPRRVRDQARAIR